VFAGWFDADAVRAVVTDDIVAGWDAIDALDGLVRKSLVVAERQENGVMRFQMLETLRQYARDRLDEHDDMDMWRSFGPSTRTARPSRCRAPGC
jgi:predicted ATPase